MPLQQLVQYFNDRLELQHQTEIPPFMINNGNAEGLFGLIKIGTHFKPLHDLNQNYSIHGYSAQIVVSENDYFPIAFRANEPSPNQESANESIVQFDRLTRTIHMLNYLPYSHLGGKLFLEVDPRHILGVKKDHGAYFEEVIHECGLKTQDVAISLTLNQHYAHCTHSLLKGLGNYQNRGYDVAIKLNITSLKNSGVGVIERSGADYIALSYYDLNNIRPEQLNPYFSAIKSLSATSIILDIDDKNSAGRAKDMGFRLAQGIYFENQLEVTKAA